MVRIVIKYTTFGFVKPGEPYMVAFALVTEGQENLYLLRCGNIIPELYDSRGVKQIVANLDEWCQVHTQLRYSLRALLDMAEAFSYGLHSSYSGADALAIADAAASQAVAQLFMTDLMAGYSAAYDIESTPPSKITAAIDDIRTNWDSLLAAYGPDEFYNRLCRWWQYCQNRCPSEVIIFEKFISRLGKTPTEAKLPTTKEWDEELHSQVRTKVFGSTRPTYKRIPQKLIEIVHAFQSRGPQMVPR